MELTIMYKGERLTRNELIKRQEESFKQLNRNYRKLGALTAACEKYKKIVLNQEEEYHEIMDRLTAINHETQWRGKQ